VQEVHTEYFEDTENTEDAGGDGETKHEDAKSTKTHEEREAELRRPSVFSEFSKVSV
jgi:hypothetical protein